MARMCPRSIHRKWRAALVAGVGLAIVVGAGLRPRASSNGLVISQVYGAGGNAGALYQNDFVELFNAGTSSISLGGMSVQYASATGTGNFGSNAITALNGILAPGQHYLVKLAGGSTGAPLPAPDALGTVNMSGSAGKVALVNSTSGLACNGGSTTCSDAQKALIIDLVGYGSANYYEGAGAAPTLSVITAAIRKGDGNIDTDNNNADFIAGTPNPRNSGAPLSTNPTGTGGADPQLVAPGANLTLKVTVTPGANPTSTALAVAVDLSAMGGNSAQALFDDGTNGDAAAGDMIFTGSATIAAGVSGGVKQLTATITDGQGRSGTATLRFAVETAAVAIHDIQGPGPSSPFADQVVTTTGVVTGVKYNGFFIQTPAGSEDSNPATSEGVFVFTSSAPAAAAATGNMVKVLGTVQEYIPSADLSSPPMTEIGGSTFIAKVSEGNTLPPPVVLTATEPDPAGAFDQLERYEGMRVRIESLTVVGPTDGTVKESNSTATSNGIFFGVATGVARPFREPGIALSSPVPADYPATDPPSSVPRFDGNPELVRVDSDALTGAAAIDVSTGAVVTGLEGPLDYGYRCYTIDPDPTMPPTVIDGPAATAVPAREQGQFTVATFNLQGFSAAADGPFQKRLGKASMIIRTMMRMPDIIGVQEVASLDVLQAIAARVNDDAVAQGGPSPDYHAYLEEGNDISGIDVGFLVKQSAVSDVVITQEGKDATFIDPQTGEPWINSHTNLPELLNDRPPLVLTGNIVAAPGSAAFPITVIVNHLRSLSGIDDPDDGYHVRLKRRAGAEFLANLIQARQAAGEHVVSVGDYNAFQFNDGYVDVLGTILGAPAPADQVVRASGDLVDPNLTDLVNLLPAAARYSYVENGSAQVLDHIVASDVMLRRFARLAFARCDADFPETLRGAADRPERLSDHDPAVAYFWMQDPAPVVTLKSLTPSVLWPVDHNMVDVTVDYDATDNHDVPVCSLAVTSNEAQNDVGDGNTAADWLVIDAHHLQLRAERSGTGSGRVYTITVSCTDAAANVTTKTTEVTVPKSQR